MKKDLTPAQQAVMEAYLLHGTVKGAARELGKAPKTVRQHLQNMGVKKPVARGDVEYTEPKRLPRKKGGRVFLFTCAQNNTHVHEPFWDNILAYAKHIGAEVHVAKVVYNHHAFLREVDGGFWYDPKIVPHLSEKNLEIAPGLVWNGELNIIPTAVNPLSGLDVFNGTKSGIFPHVKRGMISVAMPKHEAAKFNYTTGTVTQRNYVPRKAGQKASFHHIYGALIVEVDSRGRWWARQIEATDDGSFQDLDLLVSSGSVLSGSPVDACVWGDIHVAQLDKAVRKAVWSSGGILDQLQPKAQVFHDLLDFRARNHHDRGNCHLNFRKHLEGTDDVSLEIQKTAGFMSEAWREGVESVVVPSNHDDALTRWLREADYRDDPKNALFFLRAQYELYRAIAEKDKDFHLLEWALQVNPSDGVWDAEFLHVDDSYVRCGVQLGQHGHLGRNGSRGSPRQFARIGLRSITGHTHTAGIIEGNTCVGTFSVLDPDYTKGPSSWSQHFAILYPNGKISLVHFKHGRHRA